MTAGLTIERFLEDYPNVSRAHAVAVIEQAHERLRPPVAAEQALMLRVLLDHCIPRYLKFELSGHAVQTAREVRLDDVKDRELPASISGQFDVLVTMDRNLRFQQTLHGVGLGIIVLHVKKQQPDDFLRLVPELFAAITIVRNGEVRVIGP